MLHKIITRINNKTKAQNPFLGNDPNIGNNKPKTKTVNTALPATIFNPNPIGNIIIKGTMIIKDGILKIKFSIGFVFWVVTK